MNDSLRNLDRLNTQIIRVESTNWLVFVSDPPKVFLSGNVQSGLNIKRGCEICLDANISGYPYPQITWYWNDQVIRPEALRVRPDRPIKKKVVKSQVEEKKEEGEKKEEKKEGETKVEEKKEEEKKEEEQPAEAEPEESDYPTINERLSLEDCKRGESRIVVKDTIRGDHGVYTITVKNDQGKASASCDVNVLGKISSALKVC